MSQTNPGEGPEPMDEGHHEVSVVSSDRAQLSVGSRRSPLLPSSNWMARMQQRGRSETPRPPPLRPEMIAQWAQLKQWLGLFVPNLSQSLDAQHLSYNDLPEQTQLDATYLRKVRRRLEAGEKLAAEEMRSTNELMKTFMETSSQTQQHVIAQIEAKFASSDDKQNRTGEAIESEEGASWRCDRELAQEIVGSKGQLDNHKRLINVLGTELVNQRVAWEESDRQLAEMKTMLESLLNQVKGKGKESDPTPEKSMAAGGGNGGNRPPPLQQAAPGAPGGGDSDDVGDDEEGSKKGRRDERPARKG